MKDSKKAAASQRRLRKKRVLCITLACVLTLSVVFGAVSLALSYSPSVMTYGGASLREDAYAYWFACYKYEYLTAYKQLGIEDSEEGWEKETQDGERYGDAFKAAIDKEIAMRFIASVLYDKSGEELSESVLSSLSDTMKEMEAYSYGADMYGDLKDSYGIRKAGLKRVALYEIKYKALLAYRFGSDYSGVFASEYAEELAQFYSEHYSRYSFVYLSDEKNADTQDALRTALAAGLSDAEFLEWEREFSEAVLNDGQTAVNEKYPNGIYLYDGMRYDSVFSATLLNAFYALGDEGEVTEVRTENGTYFVRRLSLDEKPYLSKDEKVQSSLEGFAEYAARAFYRAELEECLDDVLTERSITDTYTLARVKKEALYNIVNLIK